jgi:hypothetical protein
MKFLSSVESWNSVFEWGSLFLVAGTVAFGAGAILTSRIIKAKQEALVGEANTKAAEANKAAAEANERAAKLEKDAAEARLELAKIDPLNLPIRSIKADVFFGCGVIFSSGIFKKMIQCLKEVAVPLAFRSPGRRQH